MAGGCVRADAAVAADNRVDIVTAGMGDTPERRAAADFVDGLLSHFGESRSSNCAALRSARTPCFTWPSTPRTVTLSEVGVASIQV